MQVEARMAEGSRENKIPQHFLRKRKYISMWWYKLENEINYGDELGPLIVQALSGSQIRYIPYVNSIFNIIIDIVTGLLNGRVKIVNIKSTISEFMACRKEKQILLTVGSILSSHNRKDTLIWGSGILYKDASINEANFYAVRGKYSQKRLEDLGLSVPEVIGDPALLLPLIINKSNEEYLLGIVPHYLHYEAVKERVKNDSRIRVINFRDDVENTTRLLSSCKYTISSSLHGLIVSHAYGIPSLWARLSEIKLGGDEVKFLDYFSSVEIKEYRCFEFDIDNLDPDYIIRTIDDNKDISLIQNNLDSIQADLIRVAPFKILEKYSM